MKKIRISLLMLVIFLFSISNVFAWNKVIYNKVLENVLSSLPAELANDFRGEVKDSIEAFLKWNDDFGSKGHLKNPIHFFSTESFGGSPEVIKERLMSYRNKIDEKKGTLLWTVLRYVKATVDLAETNPSSFPKMLGLLVHFVTDLNSPLHATKYVDGKTKAQEGLHFSWEETISKKLLELDIQPVVPEEIEDLNAYVIDNLIRSWELSGQLFEIESQVVQENGGVRSGNYSEILFEKTKDIAQKQLQNAVKMVVDIIYTAYEKAKLSGVNPYNVSITKIYHWSNNRYVTLKNFSKRSLSLKNWRLYCYEYNTGTVFNYFEFRKTIILPNKEVRIHSGPSAARVGRAKDLFWSLKRIWGDHAEAVLVDSNGKIVDLYVY